MHQANIVKEKAINYITQKEWLGDNRNIWAPRKLKREFMQQDNKMSHYCAPVIHPVKGKIITQYRELSRDPTLSEV